MLIKGASFQILMGNLSINPPKISPLNFSSNFGYFEINAYVFVHFFSKMMLTFFENSSFKSLGGGGILKSGDTSPSLINHNEIAI